MIIQDEHLIKAATSSAEGRQFWTGGRLEDAMEHLQHNPNDVCMVRLFQPQNDRGESAAAKTSKIVLLGGPIPQDTLLDVTNRDFSDIADSFDVGEMTNLVVQWFQNDFKKQGN